MNPEFLVIGGGVIGLSIAKFFDSLRAKNLRLPFDLGASRLNNPNRRRRDLRPDPIAGNEGDCVFCHNTDCNTLAGVSQQG